MSDDLLVGGRSASGFGESKAGGSTLLAQLGFADKDRQNPRHDLAVAFVQANAVGVLRAAGVEPSRVSVGNAWSVRVALQSEVRIRRPDLRGPDRPCELLVGFADGVFYSPAGRYEDGDWWNRPRPLAILEVKITRTGAGDIARQVAAYRGGFGPAASHEQAPHYGHLRAIAVLDYDISQVEADMLREHKITPMRLGASFEAFVAAQTDARAALPTL